MGSPHYARVACNSVGFYGETVRHESIQSLRGSIEDLTIREYSGNLLILRNYLEITGEFRFVGSSLCKKILIENPRGIKSITIRNCKNLKFINTLKGSCTVVTRKKEGKKIRVLQFIKKKYWFESLDPQEVHIENCPNLADEVEVITR